MAETDSSRVEQLTASDFPELMNMLVTSFRTKQPDHAEFDAVFPDVYQPTDESMAKNHVLRRNGRIASCVGLFPIKVLIGETPTTIAGIGGVSTQPEFRNQGLMRILLDHVQGQILERGYPFTWLGGDRKRYMPWGHDLAVNEYQFTLNSRGPGFDDYLGKLPGAVRECTVDEADWPTLWQQAQRNRSLIACGEEQLRLKYKRIGQKVLYLDGPDAAHVVFCVDGSSRELRAWGGDPELVGAIVADKLNRDGESLVARLPWYPDPYCPVFKALMSNYTLAPCGNIAVYDLEKTLNLFKWHLDRRVREFGLKGTLRLAMGPCRQIPAQEVVLEADGSQLAISRSSGGSAPKLDLTCWQVVEVLFTPLAVGWSVRLDPKLRWLTALFPVPFYLPLIHHI
jgi:predicted N-acetyltransferase YhbS